ncbi:hypothetical protein SA496_01620 [Pseudomonas sp. JS3066]|jgi:hypothetical protein|uniref:hypothetical protein n=1 Tax=unclassified Pseudomonas TaxID=196821 RepID=UPI000EA9AA03|nr:MULTISPECIES: hypothetical protein [unclassified Pseudomonas]AYF88549.1 hypothetical protein D6Z43_15850 [Pseudomonas sp. DY-1]MDH4656540.1 hypothetical protein [Pseudomonas sp. BN606]MRK23540.1 hypothetical protein [Pseudomonas sp. JG-B]WVK93913.1 hypothetical protein SA496_01620 [Pseudomonas sp. JS3066]
MQYSTALSDGVLAFACLSSVIALSQLGKGFAETERPAWFCALLGLLIPAAAALCGVVRFSVDPSWREAHSLLSQAGTFLALPLVALAIFALSRSATWSRAFWGRLVIGLCVVFELARRAGLLAEYRLLLSFAAFALILLAGLGRLPQRASPALAALAIVGLFLVAGLLVGTEGFMGSLRRVDLFHALLTPAYPLMTWLLLQFRDTVPSANKVKAL